MINYKYMFKNFKFKNYSLYIFIFLILSSFSLTYILLIPDSDIIKDKSNIDNWKGAIVDRKHAQICKMEDRFYNMKPLPKPKDTDIIPRCITPPYLRDIKLV